MSQKTDVKPRTRTKTKVERPKLWKVILLNDDYTPREFVVMVLKAVFRMGEETAYAEHRLEHHHDEFARRVVVVEQDHLPELRALGLGLGAGARLDVGFLAHRDSRDTAMPSGEFKARRTAAKPASPKKQRPADMGFSGPKDPMIRADQPCGGTPSAG